MDWVVEWMKEIAIFYVIGTFIMNLIHDEKYVKYVKLFLGVIMIILIITPVGKFLGLDGSFIRQWKFNSGIAMSNELVEELKNTDEKRQQAILSEYYELVKTDIAEYTESLGVYLTEASFVLNLDSSSETYGTFEKMDIYVSRTKNGIGNIYVDEIIIGTNNPSEDIVAIEIKKYIEEVYNVKKSNINVYVRGG